jgi:hypothetical protein
LSIPPGGRKRSVPDAALVSLPEARDEEVRLEVGGDRASHGVTPSNAEGGTTRDHGVTPSNAEGGTTRDVVLVLDGDVEVVLWRMDGTPDPDLWVVDALARLQLAARQVGGSIRLRNPCERLRALIDFAGLSEVFPDVVDGAGAPEPESPEA